jgi:anthranilate synthase component 1
MEYYSKTLFLDQFTPVSIYAKIKSIFTNDITFLFESTVNSADGNFSYIIIGDRERVWHKDKKSFYKNENGDISQIQDDPFDFLKQYYSKLDNQIYKDIANQLKLEPLELFMLLTNQ